VAKFEKLAAYALKRSQAAQLRDAVLEWRSCATPPSRPVDDSRGEEMNRIAVGLVALGMFLPTPAAFAQYPAKPIRMIVPAGRGTVDGVARVIGPAFLPDWAAPSS